MQLTNDQIYMILLQGKKVFRTIFKIVYIIINEMKLNSIIFINIFVLAFFKIEI